MVDNPVFGVATERSTLVVSPRRNISSLAEEQVQDEWDAIISAVEQPGVEHVVFDFSNIQYFGSSMLEAMLFLWKRIHPEGGRMAVCNVSDTAHEILRLSKFDTIWPVVGSLPDALDLVNTPATND